MNISIIAQTIELTPSIKDYIEKRLRKISKYTAGAPQISIDVGKTSGHHKQGDIFEAKINVVTTLGKQYYASSKKSDLYEAIDDVRSEIIRTLSSEKGKNATLFRRGANKIKKILKGLRS